MNAASNKSILIVEDSPDLQDLLSELLRTDGYIPVQAFNGKQALELLLSMPQKPSLILLDIMMPVMDGLEFLERKKKSSQLDPIPVVVMSADLNAEANAKSLRIDAFIPKPIKNVTQLLDLVERHRLH